MDRRRFLASGAAAAALPFVSKAPRAAVRAAGSGGPIRKAVKLGMIQAGTTLEEKLRLAKAAGFDGIEPSSPSDLDLDALRLARDAVGLEIHGVVGSEHWRSPLSHPDRAVREKGRRALEQALRDCKALGGSTVLLVPAVVNKQIGYAEAWVRSQEEIAKVLPLARDLGVAIALENVWNGFLLSPLEAARYVDDFRSSSIGWYFDVGNVVNTGWPEQWIRILGARILKLDVKEYSRKRRDAEGLWKGFGVKIGDGDCDWPAVMEALGEIGYSGWATAEVPGGDEERLRDIARRMDRVLAR